jgi:catechol 2,3-dioxygenase-like lactoylglutathione lyase family enzyme
MKFFGTLIAVKDIQKSRKFYEDLFGLKVEFDFGVNVSFDCGLFLHEGYSDLIGVPEIKTTYKANNFELYFEEENIDDFILKLEKYDGVEYIHPLKEYSWGQRVVRIYDLDKHIIEIGESMAIVAKNFLKKGLSVEEIAKKLQYPIEFIKNCVD